MVMVAPLAGTIVFELAAQDRKSAVWCGFFGVNQYSLQTTTL